MNFTASIDTSHGHGRDVGLLRDAGPTGGLAGVVRSAVVFLNEDWVTLSCPAPPRSPNFYVDDLVVTVTDGHNLVGNPNFEAGLVDGWNTTAP